MKTRKRISFARIMVFCILIVTSCDSGQKTAPESEQKNASESTAVQKPVVKQQPAKPPLFEKVGEVTVGAKNHASQSYSPSKITDKNMGSFWHSNSESVGDYGWVSISYAKLIKVSKYKIYRRLDVPLQAPVDFIVEGSAEQEFPNSDNQWAIIDEQTNQNWADTMHSYTIKQPRVFKHYRLTIHKTGDPRVASIAEWELME